MNFQTIAAVNSLYSSFVPKAYDLAIQPNAFANGMPVEADMYGSVVAATFPSGVSFRNNVSYVIACTNTQFEFVDATGIIHPLD